MVFMELCAGSAGLSYAMQQGGWQVFAFDYHGNRFKSKVHCFELDLTQAASIDLLEEMISQTRPKLSHFGLMCGTCSRARDRPVSPALRARGAPSPQPLRDAEHLLGLPGLNEVNQQRVSNANQVYFHAVRLLYAFFLVGTVVTIENPSRSWLWAVMALLVKHFADERNCPDFKTWYFNFTDVLFDACMHGGTRAKSTKLLVSDPAFTKLAILCDETHQHEAWTLERNQESWIFATAAEAAYATLFCNRYAECAATLVEPQSLKYTARLLRLASLTAQSIQTTKAVQLVPEFFKTLSLEKLPKTPHKVLGRLNNGGNNGDNAKSEARYKVGIYHTYEQHMNCAFKLPHPALTEQGIPDDLKEAVFFVATHSLAQTAEFRLKRLSECVEVAKRLALSEKLAKLKMDANVAEVTKNKRLELWEDLLNQVGFEDMMVVDHMRNGVELTGWEPESPLYRKRWNPPTLTTQQLDASAVWRRKALMSKTASADELEHAPQLLEETMKEVELGFLAGPYLEAEVSQMLGCNDWSMSQRFLLLQGEELKPRVIDNYKASAINSAFGTSSHLDLHDTDIICCLLAFMLRVFTGERSIDIQLSTGKRLQGERHRDFDRHPQLWGRGVDLSKAYKQVGIAPTSLKHGALGVRLKDGTWRFFLSKSLPFGATASVYAFNKITRGLWSLLVRKFCIFSTVFYDDFPIMEFSSLASTTAGIVQNLLDLLGWKHATTGKKSVDFGGQMQVLGVTYWLEEFWNGNVTVANRESRVNRILDMLTAYATKGAVSSSEAATMHGLLNYAGGFVVGRCLKPAARYFANMTSGSSDSEKVSKVCNDTMDLLRAMQPRIVRSLSNCRPAVIYTDGAYENEDGTWGAVVFIPDLGINTIHWGTVQHELLEHWRSTGISQLISQIELFVVLLVKFEYGQRLSNKSAIYFIDNEAARYSLIKGASPSDTMYSICKCIAHLDAKHPTADWYERVPSASNISDLPSRCKQTDCRKITNGLLAGDIALPFELLQMILKG